MATSERKQAVTIAVRPALLKRIDQLAKAKGESRSEAIEHLLLDALEDEELAVRAISNPVISQALLGAMAQPQVMRSMLHAMRSELSDDQLELFSKAMTAATEAVTPARPQAATEPASTKGKGKQKRKGSSSPR